MPEGVHAHISISGRPLRGKAGALTGGVLVFRDITRLQHTEVALERTIAEQKDQALLMETILSSISDGVLVANDEGKFTFFNPSAEQITGGMLDLKSEQWAGNYGVFYSDQKTRMTAAELPLVRAVQGEATDDVEMFVRNKKKPDGYHVSVSGRPLKTDVEGHGGGVIVFRDITKQKEAAAALDKTMEELRKQSELMETMFNSISDGISRRRCNGAVLLRKSRGRTNYRHEHNNGLPPGGVGRAIRPLLSRSGNTHENGGSAVPPQSSAKVSRWMTWIYAYATKTGRMACLSE